MHKFIDNLVAIAVIAGIAFVTVGFFWVLFIGYMTKPPPA